MADMGAAAPNVPTQDERTMATLAHVLQIVGAWIAPLIIFLLKRESKFVSFHALQALFLQLCYLAVWVIFMAIWFATIFGAIATSAGSKGQPPTAVFLAFPFIWLAAMGMWVVMLVAAIVYGIKAGRGEWAEYPIVGGWARRALKM